MNLLDRRGALGGALSLAALLPAIASAASNMSAKIQAYRWTTVPYGGGGYVDGFLYHPKEKGLLYARTDVGGLYRFDYGARTWIPLLDLCRMRMPIIWACSAWRSTRQPRQDLCGVRPLPARLGA